MADNIITVAKELLGELKEKRRCDKRNLMEEFRGLESFQREKHCYKVQKGIRNMENYKLYKKGKKEVKRK